MLHSSSWFYLLNFAILRSTKWLFFIQPILRTIPFSTVTLGPLEDHTSEYAGFFWLFWASVQLSNRSRSMRAWVDGSFYWAAWINVSRPDHVINWCNAWSGAASNARNEQNFSCSVESNFGPIHCSVQLTLFYKFLMWIQRIFCRIESARIHCSVFLNIWKLLMIK